MSKYKQRQQCPYNEGCWCRSQHCERCGWYPKEEKKEEAKEEKE